MKSRVVKCSVFLAGHHTSVSLEDEFWHGLKGIAAGPPPPAKRSHSRNRHEAAERQLSSALGCSCWSTIAAKVGALRPGGLD
jgi:predicted DNA-binding ribbon-helix-helix protein